MNRLILVIALAVAAAPVFAQTNKNVTAKATAKPAAKTAVPVFKNNKDSVGYALGVRILQSMKAQGFENVNMAMMQRAMNDVIGKKPIALDDAAISACMGKYQQEVNTARMAEQQKENAVLGAVNRKAGQDFLTANAKKPGVITLPSGLQYEVIKESTDTRKPTLASRVKCHYTGTLLNGTKFDSSVDRGEPITFPLSNVIQGWQIALQLMSVGSKWKLYIPAELGYGDNPQPGGAIRPGDALVFEVELLDIEN